MESDSHPLRPAALLLGLSDTGYGTVRSLSAVDAPIIAFEKDPKRPETKTKLCKDILFYRDENELLTLIEQTCRRLPERPALFVSGDTQVNFVNSYRDRLLELVQIDFPAADVVATLLEKTRFSAFAIEHGFKIPRTIAVVDHSDYLKCSENITFPCVVKPTWRNPQWKAARFPKVFIFNELSDLDSWFDRILEVTPELIIQEWIPGADSEIFFCLTYFDQQSNCLAYFTGRKLRQWPVGTGSTSCAEPEDQEIVTQETIRLFRQLNFRGFGSVEFKRHQETGEFFIMEPTVGRCNHQSYVATANGVNIPAIAYSSLTGVELNLPNRRHERVFWIDDQFDLLSILVACFTGKLQYRNLIRSYIGKKSFRFLCSRDLAPLANVLLQAPGKLLKYIRKVARLRFHIAKRGSNSSSHE